MSRVDILLSVLIVVRNDAPRVRDWLKGLSSELSELVNDHEIIVLDNASTDGTITELESLTAPGGLPNIQCYALTKQVDFDTACWAGLSSALGDFVAVLERAAIEADILPGMLAAAMEGAEVVLANNTAPAPVSAFYRFSRVCFFATCRLLTGVDLRNDAPRSRLLSRRVVNYLHQFNVPTVMYRALPAAAGFTKAVIPYHRIESHDTDRDLWGGFDRGVQLLVTTTSAPLRIVNLCSLFGAVANVVYSLYVIFVALTQENIARGWTTLSLQQSGMFFLLSVVLFVLGEYVLNIPALSAGSPRWHVTREFMSATISRRDRLNVQESIGRQPGAAGKRHAHDV